MLPDDSGDKKKRPDVQASGTEEQQCIWMDAGVVNFKLCDRAYDCLSCPFDKAMSEAWGIKPGGGAPPAAGPK